MTQAKRKRQAQIQILLGNAKRKGKDADLGSNTEIKNRVEESSEAGDFEVVV